MGLYGIRKPRPGEWRGSVHCHALMRTYNAQLGLNIVHAIAAMAMLLGRAPALASLIAWYLSTSLHEIEPTQIQGGDQILENVLFFSALIPHEPLSARARSPPSFMGLLRKRRMGRLLHEVGIFVVQVSYFVYLFWTYIGSVLRRSASVEWVQDLTAVSSILHDDSLAKPAGRLLRQFPDATRALTWASMTVEYYGPMIILLGSNIAGGYLRLAAVASLMALHVGLGTSIALGYFQTVCVCALVPMLPPRAFDVLRRRIGASAALNRVFGVRSTSHGSKRRDPTKTKNSSNAGMGLPLRRRRRRAVGDMEQGNVDQPRTIAARPRRVLAVKRRSVAKGSIARSVGVAAWRLVRLGLAITAMYVAVFPSAALSALLPVRSHMSFYKHADRMASGYWTMPAHLRNGKVIDIWGGGPIDPTRALADAKPLSKREPDDIPKVFPTRHFRQLGMILIGLSEKGRISINDYFRYVCTTWNGARSNGKGRVKHSPNDLVKVSLQVYASMGAPDYSERTWLTSAFGWRWHLRRHRVEIGRFQCLPGRGIAAGSVKIPGIWKDPMILRAMRDISKEARARKKQLIGG